MQRPQAAPKKPLIITISVVAAIAVIAAVTVIIIMMNNKSSGTGQKADAGDHSRVIDCRGDHTQSA